MPGKIPSVTETVLIFFFFPFFFEKEKVYHEIAENFNTVQYHITHYGIASIIAKHSLGSFHVYYRIYCAPYPPKLIHIHNI